MSDGPFRDDQEAAHARADALEEELEREKAENARLRALVEKPAEKGPATEAVAAAPAPKEAAEAAARLEGDGTKWWLRGPVLLAVAAIAVKVLVDYRYHAAWIEARTARTYERLRWRLMTEVGACVRITEARSARVAGLDATSADPRKKDGAITEAVARVQELEGRRLHRRAGRTGTQEVASSCVGAFTADAYWDEFRDEDVAAKHDRTLDHFATAIRHPLEVWIDREHELDAAGTRLHEYYVKRDYVDDDYRAGPALWAGLRTALEARDAAVATIRAEVLPVVHQEMRAEQAAYEARSGRDALWWRIELGFMLDDLLDAAFRAHGPGQNDAVVADLVREPARRLIEAAKGAPLDVRREVRANDALVAMAGTAPYAAWSTIETLASWQAQAIWDDDGNRRAASLSPTPPDPPPFEGWGGCVDCAR
jgi:hypothetical protein